MVSLTELVKWIEKNSKLIMFLGFVLSAYILERYSLLSQIETNFLTITLAFFAFIAIFYTVTIVTSVIQSIRSINASAISRLRTQIRALSERENRDTLNEEQKAEICQQKITVYEEIGRLRNRNLNSMLFQGTLVFLSLILIRVFLPEVIPIINIRNIYLSIFLLWLGIYYTLNIIIIFYFANDRR